MNHSCDPACWFEGNYLMTATRDLAVGDEARDARRASTAAAALTRAPQVTFDYSTSNDWAQDWTCACGTALCRGKITGAEWKEAALQARYAGHFLPHIAARIAASQ
jgi:hypothetical protein